MTTTKADGPDFASPSLARHLARGAIGFGGLIGSVALVPLVGPVSLLLLPAGLLALRGCPMCWAIGLTQTISRGRLRRTCEDGRCTLTVADRGMSGERLIVVGGPPTEDPPTEDSPTEDSPTEDPPIRGSIRPCDGVRGPGDAALPLGCCPSF